MGLPFPCLRTHSQASTLTVCDPCSRLDDAASVTAQPRTHPDASAVHLGHHFASAQVDLNVRTKQPLPLRSDSQPTERRPTPLGGTTRVRYVQLISESVLLSYVAAPFTLNDIEESRVERQRGGIRNPASPFGADRKAGARQPQQIRKYHSERLTTVSTRFFGSGY